MKHENWNYRKKSEKNIEKSEENFKKVTCASHSLIIAILINEWAAHKHELAAWNTDIMLGTIEEGGEM